MVRERRQQVAGIDLYDSRQSDWYDGLIVSPGYSAKPRHRWLATMQRGAILRFSYRIAGGFGASTFNLNRTSIGHRSIIFIRSLRKCSREIAS